MKKQFIFSLLSLAFFQNYAQIEAGSKYLNGGFGFYMQNVANTSNRKQYNLQSNVNMQYAIFKKENIATYVALNYGISNIYGKENTANNWQKFVSLNNSISVAYGKHKWFALPKIHPNLYLTLQGGVSGSLGLGTTSNTNQDSTITASNQAGVGFNFSISPSLALFLSKKWLLQASLGNFMTGYNVNRTGKDGNYFYTHSFSFSPNFNPSSWNIGISYFWDKKVN